LKAFKNSSGTVIWTFSCAARCELLYTVTFTFTCSGPKSEYCQRLWCGRTTMAGVPGGKKFDDMFNLLRHNIGMWWTDRQRSCDSM